MSEESATLSYATNDPAVIAPWRRVRFSWMPATVASSVFLIFLQIVAHLPVLKTLPARVAMMLAWIVVSLPIVSCFAAFLIKRRGRARSLVAASALLLLLSPAILPLEKILEGRVDGGDVQSTWLALGFVALAACWLWEGWLSWSEVMGASLLAAAVIWVLLLVILDAVAFVPALQSDAKLPGSKITVHWAHGAALYAFIFIAWVAIGVLERLGRRGEKKLVILCWMLSPVIVLLGCIYRGEPRTRMIAWGAATYGVYDSGGAWWTHFLNRRPASATLLHVVDSFPWESYVAFEETYRWRPIPSADSLFPLLPDDEPTALALAEILQRHPCEALADRVAARLALHRRYEVAPVLLYYALFAHDDSCRNALVSMRIRQVAWACIYTNGPAARPSESWKDPGLSALFPTEGMHSLSSWLTVAWEKARGRHPPMPDAVSDACDDVIRQYRRYVAACDDLMDYFKRHPIGDPVTGTMIGVGVDNCFGFEAQAAVANAAVVAFPAWSGISPNGLEVVVDKFVGAANAFLASHAAASAPASPK